MGFMKYQTSKKYLRDHLLTLVSKLDQYVYLHVDISLSTYIGQRLIQDYQ